MQVKEPMREARSMVKERWLDRRVDKLARENDRLRSEVEELRHDLDETQDRSSQTIKQLAKSRRPGRMKWLVLAGGAYVLGAKAGRARYEQIRGWARSVSGRDGDTSFPDTSATVTPTSTTPSTTSTSTSTRTSKSSGSTGTGTTP
jgi:cell division septum initiation protein DivIVA